MEDLDWCGYCITWKLGFVSCFCIYLLVICFVICLRVWLCFVSVFGF